VSGFCWLLIMVMDATGQVTFNFNIISSPLASGK
jgi:hypothetical protein